MKNVTVPFLYSPVDTANGEIRLLTLHPATDKEASIVCDLERVRLRDNPQFEAISYTWGAEHPSVQIILNDSTFYVRENAAAALRRLRRRKGSRRVWIDAICINQEEVPERDRQITVMQHIFGQASQVIIWLGEPTEQGILGIRYLQGKLINASLRQLWLEVHGDDMRPSYTTNISTALDRMTYTDDQLAGEIRELLDRPWWRRTWVVQEAVLAQKLVVMCGEEVVTWDMIRKLIDGRRISRPNFEVMGIVLDETAFPDGLFRFISEYRQRWHDSASGINLLEILYRCRALECSEPQDKIFGLLGIAPSAKAMGVVPDSTASAHEVYRDFALKFARGSQSLDILNYAREWQGAPGRFSKQQVYSLLEQSKYHDVKAQIDDGPGKKPRQSWARLPDGWERIPGKVPKFHNYKTNETSQKSPLAGSLSQAALIMERRELPTNWQKKWDNLGRATVSHELEGDKPATKLEGKIAELLADLAKLPSWVPNWYTPTAWDPEPLLDFSFSHPLYWASGDEIPHVPVGPSECVLSLSGFVFDEIESIAPAWHPQSEQPALSRKGNEVLIGWEEHALRPVQECPYKDSSREEALWRTMIADWAGAHAAPESDRYYVEVWYDRNGWARQVPDVVNMGVWEATMEGVSLTFHEVDMLSEFATFCSRDDVEYPSSSTGLRTDGEHVIVKQYGAYVKRIQRACAHRALFVTRKGYIGLAPWNAKEGDVVAVLDGGKTPYILRSASVDQFKLVGESFVYGVMAGEALQHRKALEKPESRIQIV
ncbi:unnamed protein product [Clonostachys byssicola]|uniref:Heterokaryon incompatibility domain-containing protein n=1 Tax=Clonostachys byssicola TaxID=160290 RepID=A0A9N9U5Q8_9HYPO|nr:unnamed protein product [Clonostachys byssicola]